MQTKIIKHKKFAVLLILGILSIATFFTSCKKDDKNNNVELFSYGPVPIARGAELKFIGVNLDKVTSIVLPDNIEILVADFGSQTSDLITITVPQNAVEGFVVLKYANGEITTKTPIGFSEPITLDAFSPVTIKPGSELTITGEYLNLIGQVIFPENAIVDSTDFISQSRNEIKLIVPEEAKSGKITITNGAADPIIIYSQSELSVILPAVSAIAPNPIKVGTDLTITGTDLDLVKLVSFGGNRIVTTFTEQTTTSITVTVPLNAEDGKIIVVPASLVQVESTDELVMVDPSDIVVNPTSVKNGETIAVTGTDLDLINKVTFGGGIEGTIQGGGTSTAISVTVPDAALTGEILFGTTTNKSISGGTITIIDPAITNFAPTSVKAGADIVITGSDLDLVASVKFFGGITGTIGARTGTSLTVTVPVGAQTGVITLVAINGVNVESSGTFTILQNLPVFTSFSELKGTQGKILTLNGTNMDLIKTLIFPGNIAATEYGIKSSTIVEVYVPMEVPLGIGQIKEITYEGEEGLLPALFFGYQQPITAQTIIVMDYEQHGGHNGYWDAAWNTSFSSIMNENGNTFITSTGSINGWFMNCNHQGSGAPGPIIDNIENYVLKVDVRTDIGVTGAENAAIQFVFGDNWKWYGAGLIPASTYGDWVTVSIPVSTWNLTGTLNLSSGTNGLYGGPIPAGVSMDNIRFDPK